MIGTLPAQRDILACDRCGMEGDDSASVAVTGQEWGFCSLACMVLFVRETYIETEPRASAVAAGSGSPSAVGDRPAATGEAQGRRPLGSAGTVQASPTSEAGA